jgi:hypothetical protein
MNYNISSADTDASRYPELRKWVVGALSGHKKPNEIIFQLCQRTGWDWNLAKRFVEQVIEMDQKEVHQRRMPLLVGIGILFVITGTVSFISAFIDLKEIFSTLEPPWDFQKFFDALLMARSIYLLVGKLVLGLVGVVGGGYGISNAVKSAISGEGDDLLKSQTHQQ